jgi:hypothetical protein
VIGFLQAVALFAPATASTPAPTPGTAASPPAGDVAPYGGAAADDGAFSPELPAPARPLADECPEAVDLVPGQPLPAGLLDAQGRVRCRATVVPTSDLADLLLVDAWAHQAQPRLALAQLDLGWEQARRAELEAALNRPIPWTQRPETQRWAGRIETVVTFAVVGGLYALADDAR